MKITLTTSKKQKTPAENLVFGHTFTDHMLVMDYKDGQWGEPEILPFGNFSMSPATNVLHYSQGVFEGAKAYKDDSGKVTTFRINDNLARLNRSAKRLAIPAFDEKLVKDAIYELLRLESDWIPTAPNTSLYIRPTIIANQEVLGIGTSKSYKFFTILSPVGIYYKNGLAPVKIKVEEFYARSVLGGTGDVKCIANYSQALLAADIAKVDGFDQVLWLDGQEKKYVEEVGSMNIFFVTDKEVITPALTGTLLPGITRASCIEILKKTKKMPIVERKIEITEIVELYKAGKLKECFGTGTASIVAPVGVISYKGDVMVLNDNKTGAVTSFMYETMTGLQYGKIKDDYGWVEQVK